MGLLDRSLNIGESKQFREYEKRVERINAYEPELELESDDELRERFGELRERADNGESLDDLLPETFAIVLNALAGKGVHLVTVNDYLARRDAEWMSPIYNGLGLNVGVLQNMQSYEDKHLAYAADVTYGTNSEFGFDYLRDNMATALEEKV